MLSGRRSPWPLVAMLYATGLLAAAQLGKLSALAPLIAAELRLSLPTMATAISLLEVGGATLGAVAGLLAHRLGLRRTLRWGVAALALAGLGSALAQGVAGLMAWRVLEAAGYLGVIVSAPVLIAHHAGAAGARTQGLALTLWSTFVPVGLALGAWASAGAAGALGWRGAVLGGGVVAAGLWLALWRSPLPPRAADALDPTPGPAATHELTHEVRLAPGEVPPSLAPAAPRLGPAAWCLALSFHLFALFEVGVLALLPTLLVQQVGLDAAAAGRWTGIAALAAVGGSAIAALLLRRGAALRAPVMAALGLPALLLFAVFTPAPPPAVAIAGAITLNLLGGIYASLSFALLPRVAGGPAQMVKVNGLLAQCGASGSLLGPPLMAACVQAGGWPAAAGLGLGCALLAMPLAWRAMRGLHTA